VIRGIRLKILFNRQKIREADPIALLRAQLHHGD